MYPYTNIDIPDYATLDRLLDRAKGQLFFKKGAGYLGSLLCDHHFKWDENISTACCNGEVITWNPRFFYWLTQEERVTVLAHELWHTGFDHIHRFTDMGTSECPDIFNEAADFVINLTLQDFGYIFGDKLMSMKPCLDEQYRSMSTEEIYHLLPKPPKNQCPQPGDDDGGGDDGTKNPGNGGSGQNDDPLADLQPSPNGTGANERQKQISKLVKAKQASQRAKEAGVVPGETELIIDKFLNPILPWEVLLQRFFTELSKDDYSWRRPNRRYEEDYLPSLLGDNGLEHIIYYIDVSGSTSDASVLRFHSEANYIHRTFKPKKLTLVTFDTELQDILEFTDEMPFDEVTIHGRGGTSLEPVRQHIKKERPSAAVIFTDLHVPPMTEDPKVPIIWVVVNNERAKVKFGQLIHIPEEG